VPARWDLPLRKAVKRKEHPLPKHKEAGERQLKARCNYMFSTQAVPQSPQKMLVSNGKNMGSDNRIAEQVLVSASASQAAPTSLHTLHGRRQGC